MKKEVIHTVFENIARQKGDHIAIETDEGTITYQDFNQQANILGHLLVQRGFQKEDVIAVFCDNAIVQIASLFGVFKSGTVYLPLNDKYKQNHWDVLYNSIQPKAIIITEAHLRTFNTFNHKFAYKIPEVIVVSTNTKNELSFSIHKNGQEATIDVEAFQKNRHNLTIEIDGEDTNYIFFTSGSTGKPKAVVGKHKSLSHFIHWESEELNVSEEDRIGQLTSFSFDASLRDIFLPLINGGRICIPSEYAKADVSELKKWMTDKKITILHTIPTMIRLFFSGETTNQTGENKFKDLKYLLLAGEKLFNKDIYEWRDFFGDNTRIINLYGTTETTLIKTFHIVEDDLVGKLSNVVSIGKPIADTTILILNEENNICQIGEVGSIYIQTPFFSKGYYNEAQLTAEKFIKNPLVNSSENVYDTGDYGTFDEDGNISILGRKDSIIKINGVRCDLNSIEKNMLEYPKIRAVKCLPHIENGIIKTILCFYEAEKELTNELKKHCYGLLSDYILFNISFVHVNAFKRNSNGKTDTKALIEQFESQYKSNTSLETPQDETSKEIIQIWKNVLNEDNITLTDDFIALGGHSLKMNLLIIRYKKVFGITVTLGELFENTSVASHVELIKNKDTHATDVIPKLPETTSYKLSDAQQKLVLLTELDNAAIKYDFVYFEDIASIENIEKFKKAIATAIQRHEILRTVFKKNKNGEIAQHILAETAAQYELEIVDYSERSTAIYDMHTYIKNYLKSTFDLAKDALIKTCLFQLPNAKYKFYIRMHQLIGDAYSLKVFYKDVITTYNAYIENKKPVLPTLNMQYKEYANWHKAQRNNAEFATAKSFWKQQLAGQLTLLDLPTEKTRPLVKTYHGKQLQLRINKELAQTLKAFCEENKGTVFIGVLSVLNILFQKLTAQKDIIIATQSLGRYRSEFEHQIGNYLNTIILRNTIEEQNTFHEIFHKIKTNTIESFEHQNYYFDWLLEDLDIQTASNRNPVYDVMMTYEDRSNEPITYVKEELILDKVTDKGDSIPKLDALFTTALYKDFLQLELQFNTDVYDEKSMTNVLNDFQRLLAKLLENPTTAVANIDLKEQVKTALKSKNMSKLKAFKI